MSPLHLVRLRLDLRALVGFAIAERVDDDDRGYALHLALRRRLGAAAPQPFRLFDEAAAGPHLLGYAGDALALTDAAGLPASDPRLDAIFPEPPACRAMPAEWRTGALYAFEVRVRPLVRYGRTVRDARRADGRIGAGERDAFLAAIEKAGDGTVERAAVYRDWLVRRMARAARVERVEIVRLRRLTTNRSPHGRQGARRIEGYEALFAGTLAVCDPAAFAHLLAHGVGRHAAFGFGMLALAPPGRG